jgi:Peptidase family M28
LRDADIRDLAAMDDQQHYQNALKNILQPRVVGTKGWQNVQNFIIDELKSMDFDVELDSFIDNTPLFGNLNFVNVIGKLNPKADKFLVLSAHYDSKHFPDGKFVGATGNENLRVIDKRSLSVKFFTEKFLITITSLRFQSKSNNNFL